MLPENAFALSNTDDKYGNAMLDSIKAKNILMVLKIKQILMNV